MGGTIDAAGLHWAQTFTGVNLGAQAWGPTPPPPPPDPAVEAAKTDITTRFAVKKVGTDGGAAWQAAELKPVTEAFDAIPPMDKDCLKDIEVERVPMLNNDPNSAAVYATMTDARTTPPIQTRKIMVADATFIDVSSGSPQVVSPAERKRKIVHEVGHVVAKKARLDADRAAAQAMAALRNADGARQRIADAIKTATGPELTQLQQQLAGLEGAVKLATQKVADTRKAVAAQKVPQATVDAGQAATDAAGTTADTTAVGAKRATLSAQEQRDSADYRQASDAVGAEIKAYAGAIKAGKVGTDSTQKHPGEMDAALDQKIQARNLARQKLEAKSKTNPALKAYAPVDRSQDDWSRKVETQARLPERSPKLQEFVEIVEHNHIDPAVFTPYSAISWPSMPEEVFADAYSFWVTKPKWLQSAAPALAAWFAAGNYRPG